MDQEQFPKETESTEVFGELGTEAQEEVSLANEIAQLTAEDTAAKILSGTDISAETNASENMASENTSAQDSYELELKYLDENKQEEKEWMERTGLNADSLCGAIETIIFMSEKPIPLLKIRSYIDPLMPLRVLHESIQRLQNEYESAHHGLRLREVSEGYQFRTKATYSKYVQDIFKVNSLILGPTALEVLAIIAYKQPVSKVEIDKIRGVDSSHIVRALMDKRLVKVTGRSEELGRPTLYGTTPEFLEVFNLGTIQELPPEHELESMAQNQVGQIADIKQIVAGDKERFKFDEWQELESLSESIKNISGETEFTRSLEDLDKKRNENQGEKPKSAFDLLEEYMIRSQLIAANKEAAISMPFAIGDNYAIVSDLTAGPYNAPLEEENDHFEMIDLNTGKPLSDDLDQLFPETDLNAELENQKQSLSEALDSALEEQALTAELDSVFEQWEDDSEDLEHLLAQKEEELAQPLEKMVQDAADLGLDIAFLQDEPTGSLEASDREQEENGQNEE